MNRTEKINVFVLAPFIGGVILLFLGFFRNPETSEWVFTLKTSIGFAIVSILMSIMVMVFVKSAREKNKKCNCPRNHKEVWEFSKKTLDMQVEDAIKEIDKYHTDWKNCIEHYGNFTQED